MRLETNEESFRSGERRMVRKIGGVRIHYNSKIPKLASVFFPVAAITIGNHIFVKEELPPLRLITHEKIHVLQGREIGFLKFWGLYGYFWIKALIKTRSPFDAYLKIPFEREAYGNEDDPNYPVTRKRGAWKDYKIT